MDVFIYVRAFDWKLDLKQTSPKQGKNILEIISCKITNYLQNATIKL